MSARSLSEYVNAPRLVAPLVFVALALSCGPVSQERPPTQNTTRTIAPDPKDKGDQAPQTSSGSTAPDDAQVGRVENGFFVVDGAPDPRACEASSDCLGDTIPDASGCCQDPHHVVPHAREYKSFIADWRKTACADVTCPAPPLPGFPEDCLFETRCIDSVCTDSCPPDWLPPVDLACQSDADCEATQAFYETEGACCQSCGSVVATTGWIESATQACSERAGDNCPVKKCAALDPASCVEGQCRAVPRDP